MLSTLYFSVPVHLAPSGVDVILDRLYGLDDVEEVLFDPEFEVFTVSTRLKSCSLLSATISSILARFLRDVDQNQDVDMDSDAGGDEESPEASEFGRVVRDLCRRRNGAGDLVPLSEHEKMDMHRFALPTAIASMPFTAVWDRLEEASAGVWQWTLRDMLRQYGTVGETLAVLAEATNTTMTTNARAQVIYIGADTEVAVQEALQRLNTLEEGKYPSQSPINLVQPSKAKRYELAFQRLDKSGFPQPMFINSGRHLISDTAALLLSSCRICMIAGDIDDKSLVLCQPKPQQPRLDIESVPVRGMTCQEFNSGLQDALMKLTLENNEPDPCARSGSGLAVAAKPPIPNVIFEPADVLQSNRFVDGPESFGAPGFLTPIDVLSSVRSRSLFNSSLLKNLAHFLNRARLWRGEVGLKLNFGRFIISSDSPAFESINSLDMDDPVGFRPDEMIMFLNSPDSPDRPAVAFSSIMTTVDSEMRAFEAEIAGLGFKFRNTTTYLDFSCTSCDEAFIVSFRASASFQPSIRFAPARAEIGRINVHCPESLNDMCVVVSVSDTEFLKAKHGDFIKFLQSKMSVQVNNVKSGNISVLYPNLSSSSVQISGLVLRSSHVYEDTANVHRIEVCSYQSFSSHLTEDKTMVVSKTNSSSSSSGGGGGASGPRKDGLPDKWHEISLATNAVNEAFKKNRKLPLGRRSEWSAQDLEADGTLERLVGLGLKITPVLDFMNSS
ncbi:uncharacterized protein BROUX77_002497 [Berkeleyomyces rouxiae]|uniref:uncharacterized protein n=1 Tax=Berkeleyomyces rouxiae TaxID=2035830 RepID=UPI003B829BA0